jgi:hypothetical protein
VEESIRAFFRLFVLILDGVAATKRVHGCAARDRRVCGSSTVEGGPPWRLRGVFSLGWLQHTDAPERYAARGATERRPCDSWPSGRIVFLALDLATAVFAICWFLRQAGWAKVFSARAVYLACVALWCLIVGDTDHHCDYVILPHFLACHCLLLASELSSVLKSSRHRCEQRPHRWSEWWSNGSAGFGHNCDLPPGGVCSSKSAPTTKCYRAIPPLAAHEPGRERERESISPGW